MQEKIQLSIGILVSNRKQYIRNVMEGIRPLLEQLPCELVAIDTKGEESDGSIEIVREYTDKIYPFTWCNDFAAARNFCLEKTRGSWFLFLDDDEWFEDASELINFFKSGECDAYGRGVFPIRNYSDEVHYSLNVVERLAKRTKELRFEGKVHEVFVGMQGERKYFSCDIHHMGYVYANAEAQKKHQERNVSILREELEREGMVPKIVAQMVQELVSVQDTIEDGIELAKKALAGWRGNREELNTNAQWIMSAVARGYLEKEQYDELFGWVAYVRENHVCTELTKLVLAAVEANAAMLQNRFALAETNAREYVAQYDWLQANPKEKQQMLQLDLPSYLTEDYYVLMLHTGAYAANREKEYTKAMDYWNRFPWNKEGLKKEVYQNELARTVQGLRGGTATEEPLLSISILVSNNITTIRNCMESIRPILEQIPSELIVVDTVGEEHSDGSLAVAKEYASKVVRFEWCNDFAAARNAGLSEAKGKWFLFMDDDEWFENTEEIIRFFKSGEYKNYASATYQIRNYTNREGTNYNVATLGRMVQRTESLRFVGKIHETFSEMNLPCKEFAAFVHHFGYVYDSEEERWAHSKRNMELLKQELEKEPANLHYRTQMALELATCNNEEALAFCEETFRLCLVEKRKNNFQWQLALVFRLYEALGVNSDTADAKYVELKQNFGYNEITENAIAYQMVRIHIINNVPGKAYPYAVKYFDTLQLLQSNPEQKQLQMTADYQRYHESSVVLEMLHFGAYSAYHAKEYGAAWNWYTQMPWEQKGFQNEEAFYLMVQLFQENRNAAMMISILKRVMKNETLIGKQEIRNTISAILASLK